MSLTGSKHFTIKRGNGLSSTKEKSGSPEDARQGVFNMLNIAPITDRVYVEDFVVDGFVTLTAYQMSFILDQCTYKHQRKLNVSHVSVLSDLMRRGQWGAKSALDFARLDGRLILVNGYHRAHSQIETNKTIEWTIVIHDCKDENDLRSLYYRFDTNNYIRSASQILEGVEFAEQTGLSKELSSGLFRAVPLIASGFSTSRKDVDILAQRVVDRRLDIAMQYVPAALAYEQCIQKTPTQLKSKLITSGCMAVALVTLRYQRTKAVEFWTGVARNDGLRRGDPRQTLFNDLISRARNSGNIGANRIGAPALAWNAFYNDRDQKIIKIHEGYQCTLDGTPFNKRHRAR